MFLAQGISLNVDFSIGIITILISIAVLIFWIPLNQKPGIGTILNALIIALMIDICIKFVPTPENYISQLFLAIVAVLTVGLGGGIYLVANLGARTKRWTNDRFTKKNKFTNCSC